MTSTEVESDIFASLLTTPATAWLGVPGKQPEKIASTPTGWKIGRTVGRFELLRQLGRGGAGVVFEARDPTLGRSVALKILHPSVAMHSPWGLRFRSEWQSLAKLSHPNVVPVYEAGEADGVAYLNMELLPGPDLYNKVSGQPLPAREAARLMAEVADGVAHAHANHLLHRDLKPSNILLDATGRPKVADFGLAAPIDGGTGLTMTGEVMGTPNYMAPEALRGEGGVPADVYGLGAILYECLTGRPPFHGGNPIATMNHVANNEPPSPRSIQPDIPRDLEAVCLKCLEKRPEARYPTAAAVAEDLRAYLAGRPTLARPPRTINRAMKWVRRNKTLTAGLVGLVLALGFGIGGLALHNHRLAAALQAEREAVARAEKHREQSTELLGVLRGVFTDLDISRIRDNDVPLERALADRLVDAAKKLNDTTLHDPIELVGVREDLGLAVQQLGFPELALPLFRTSVEALQAHPDYGPDHETTLKIQDRMADALECTGRIDLALPMMRDIYTRRLRLNGPDDRMSIFTLNHLYSMLLSAGKVEEANTFIVELQERALRVLGEDDIVTIEAEATLVCLTLTDAAELVKRIGTLVERYRRVCGETHANTLNMRMTLASALASTNDRKKEAEAEVAAAVVDTAKARGVQHPDTIFAMHLQALLLEQLHEKDKAAKIHAEAMKLLAQRGYRQGRADTIVLAAAKFAEDNDDAPRAEEWLRSWLTSVKLRQPESLELATVLDRLAANLTMQKKTKESEALSAKANTIRERLATPTP
jgi:eukaryotic-like serine/threonine-protein kinase